MIFQLSDELSALLVEHIQRWFAEHPLAQDYRWVPNPESSRIHVYEQFPDEIHRYPSVTVKVGSGSTVDSGFNQMADRLLDDAGDTVGEAFQGWYNPRAEYVVESTHDADVRRVSDLLVLALTRYIRSSVNAETKNNVIPDLSPVLSNIARGFRRDNNNRVIQTVSFGQNWKVAWHDEQVLEHDFLTADLTTQFTDA